MPDIQDWHPTSKNYIMKYDPEILCVSSSLGITLELAAHSWAALYDTGFCFELMPTGAVFSFLSGIPSTCSTAPPALRAVIAVTQVFKLDSSCASGLPYKSLTYLKTKLDLLSMLQI